VEGGRLTKHLSKLRTALGKKRDKRVKKRLGEDAG